MSTRDVTDDKSTLINDIDSVVGFRWWLLLRIRSHGAGLAGWLAGSGLLLLLLCRSELMELKRGAREIHPSSTETSTGMVDIGCLIFGSSLV